MKKQKNCSQKADKKLQHRIIVICVMLLYVVVNTVLAMHHEHWRDEAQAWLLAKNTSLPELWNMCAVEGHPMLWFLILRAAALFGLPYRYISVISLVMTAAAFYLFVEKTGCPDWMKIWIGCSSVFWYYNAAFARPYGMVALVVASIMALWETRDRHPVLYGILTAAAFQSHVIMAGFAFGLVIDQVIICLRTKGKRKAKAAGMAFSITGMSMTAAQLMPKSIFQPSVPVAETIKANMGTCTPIDGLGTVTSSIWKTPEGLEIAILAGSIVIAASLLLMAVSGMVANHRKKTQLPGPEIPFLCGFCFTLGIISYVYTGTVQLKIFFLVICMYYLTTAYHESNRGWRNQLIAVIALVLFVPTVAIWSLDAKEDLREPYSGGEAMAAYICRLPENSVVLVRNDCRIPSVYAPAEDENPSIEFYNVDESEPFKCFKWNGKVKEIGEQEIDALKEQFKEVNLYYLKTESNIPKLPVNAEYQTHVSFGYMESGYILYDVN